MRREAGVTVFLTTQYLEEADVLADRVGIIDPGKIVAEGTPAELKAEIGRPSVHAIPAGRGRPAEDRRVPRAVRRAARLDARRRRAAQGRARAHRHRARRRRERRRHRRPRAARADARRRLPREDGPDARRRGRGGRHAPGRSSAGGEQRAATQVGAIARRSVVRTSRQPASIIPPLDLPGRAHGGERRRPASSTELPGFPTDSFLAFALAVPFIQGALFSTMNAGTDIARDVQTGFVNRLSLTALRDWALLTGQLAGIVVLGVLQVVFYIVVGLAAGVRFESGPAGIAVLLVYGAIVALCVRRPRRVARVPDRLGRDDPGALPRSLRLPVHLLDERAPQPHRASAGSRRPRR